MACAMVPLAASSRSSLLVGEVGAEAAPTLEEPTLPPLAIPLALALDGMEARSPAG